MPVARPIDAPPVGFEIVTVKDSLGSTVASPWTTKRQEPGRRAGLDRQRSVLRDEVGLRRGARARSRS